MTGHDLLAGRYLVEGELGRGSMGRVLLVRDRLAYDSARAMPLALKVLEDPDQRTAFVREYELLRRLAHPAFVAPLQLLQLPASRALGTGLVALLERIEGQPLAPIANPELAFAVAHALTTAIDHLHRLGLVHGDLAPANVLWRTTPLDPDRIDLKVLDLGAGGHIGDKAGTTSGVLAYAAPERLSGSPLAPATDLWSIGALVYGLVHGRHPFPSYPARLSALAPSDTPHLLDPWLERLLAVDPADRHPSAAAALAALEALAPSPETPARPWPIIERVDPTTASTTPADPSTNTPGLTSRLRTILGTALRDKRPVFADVLAKPGSGRTAFVGSLTERMSADGFITLDLPAYPTYEDHPERWLADALTALNWPDREGGEATLMTNLGRAVQAVGAPVCIVVDDLAQAPNIRASLERLARAAAVVPEHFGPLAVVTVGLDAADLPNVTKVDLPPWSSHEVGALLRATFPGRTVLEADVDALVAITRGHIGLLIATLDAARQSGALRIDSAQVTVDRAALQHLTPTSLEAVVTDRLMSLSEDLRRQAAIMAHATFPVPPTSIIEALVHAGVATQAPADGPFVGLRLASEALARAARLFVDPAVAHSALADAYTRASFPDHDALATAHRLLAEPPDQTSATQPTSSRLALESEAERHLEQHLPPELTSFLLDALGTDSGWPRTPESALAAASLRESLGQTQPALALFERAAALATAPKDQRVAAVGAGRLEIRLARFPRALAAFERALALTPDVDSIDALELQAGLARAAVLSGQLDKAQTTSDAALARLDAQASPPQTTPSTTAQAALSIRARLLYVRALVDWYRGALDLAEPRLTEALTAVKQVDDLVEQAAIVTALGLVAHRRGDLPRASSFYAEALTLGQRAHDTSRVLTALQNLGVVRHELGQWTEALDTYRHALTLAEANDARAKVAQIAGNLGNLWRYLGEAERADLALTRGYELAKADHNRHLQAVIANLRGDVASDRGDLPMADAFYREAIDVADLAGCQPERIESSLNLARLLIERHDLDAASAVLAPVLEPARNTNEAMSLQLMCAEASILRKKGLDGKALLDVALAGIEVIKNPDQRWPLFLEAALAARDKDDFTTAETWAREVRKVLQSQLDQVPGKHREAFSQRRDRRAAYRETAALTIDRKDGAAKSPRALGWSRLLEVHKRLAGEHSVQRLLEYIMDSAILLTGAERGFLLLDDESHKEGLEVKVARNLDQENIRNRHLKISRGIARRVIASGEAVVTVDAMEDERYKEQLSVVDLRLRSILCLPMSLRGRVLGAIYLDNRFRSSAFADEDIRFMEAFADMAAIALDNARLLESLENQTKQMAVARKEIEALNERLAAELARRTQELEDTKVAILEERRHQSKEYRFDNIIGSAQSMRRVFQVIDRLRNADIAVLVEGESGTGKELVARAIHFSGSRKDRPFVAVNCGAIPATLLESELFGHVRGAFTNATSDKKGLFEVAHTGTLFLDEIGEMPLEMQVKLLRVLQSGEIQKVGATKQVTVDVRIVAATNRHLEDEVKEGRFREDLFYRLSVVPIVVPPLRERRDDVPLLVQHFIAANRKSGLGNVTGLSKEALTLLQRYAWPGNVRQLETVLKNASVFAESETLTAKDFDSFPDIVGGPGLNTSDRGIALQGRTLAELERIAIVASLRENKGNKKRTAEMLGIDRRTLYNKLAAFGIAIDSDLKVK